MTARRHLHLIPGLAIASLSVLIAGCPPEGPARPPAQVTHLPQNEVVARVNRNIAGLNFQLKGSGVQAKGEYLDADGDKERFDLNGTLLFRRPRFLFLKLEPTLAATGIEIGSNQNVFWVWKRLNNPVYWWGRYDQLATIRNPNIPIRPDQLLDVLGLTGLPAEGAASPRFTTRADHYELSYPAAGIHGAARSVYVSRTEPVVVSRVVFHGPQGRPAVEADLSDYRAVRDTSILLPHKIQMRWHQTGNWLNLEISSMRRMDSSDTPFQSPLDRGKDVGQQIRVDQEAPVTDAAEPRASSRVAGR